MTPKFAPILAGLVLLAACSAEPGAPPPPDAGRIKADLVGSGIGQTGDADACDVGWNFDSVEEFARLDVQEATEDGDRLTIRAEMMTDVPAGTLTADLVVLYRLTDEGWAFDSVFSPACTAEMR